MSDATATTHAPVEAILHEVLDPRAFRRWLAAQTELPITCGHHVIAAYLEQFFPSQYIYTPSYTSVCIGAAQCYEDPATPHYPLPAWAAALTDSFPRVSLWDDRFWETRKDFAVHAMLARFDALMTKTA